MGDAVNGAPRLVGRDVTPEEVLPRSLFCHPQGLTGARPRCCAPTPTPPRSWRLTRVAVAGHARAGGAAVPQQGASCRLRSRAEAALRPCACSAVPARASAPERHARACMCLHAHARMQMCRPVLTVWCPGVGHHRRAAGGCPVRRSPVGQRREGRQRAHGRWRRAQAVHPRSPAASRGNHTRRRDCARD